VLLCLTAPAASPVSAQSVPTWHLCPGAPTSINITNVTLSLQGRDLALAMEANVQETLEQGSLTIGVSLNGGQMYDSKHSGAAQRQREEAGGWTTRTCGQAHSHGDRSDA